MEYNETEVNKHMSSKEIMSMGKCVLNYEAKMGRGLSSRGKAPAY